MILIDSVDERRKLQKSHSDSNKAKQNNNNSGQYKWRGLKSKKVSKRDEERDRRATEAANERQARLTQNAITDCWYKVAGE